MATAVLTVLPATAMAAQPRATVGLDEKFDVISIRPREERAFRRATVAALPGGRFEAINATVADLISFAYDIRRPQRVIGGSLWVRTQAFDVSAKATASWTESVDSTTSTAAMRRLVQSMLADRFNLVVHWEKGQEPGRALVLARKDGRLGPDLTPSKIDCPAEIAARAKALVETNDAKQALKSPGSAQGPDCNVITTNGRTKAIGQSMVSLAFTLSSLVGETVVDRTGIDGTFDIEMNAAPIVRSPELQAAMLAQGIEFDAPPLAEALRDQLGLRLEPIQVAIEILVVDQIDEPEPN